MMKYDEWLSTMYVQICVQHQICGLGNLSSMPGLFQPIDGHI